MPRTLCFRGLILVLVLTLAAPSAFAAGRVMAGSGTTSSVEGDAHGTMDPNG